MRGARRVAGARDFGLHSRQPGDGRKAAYPGGRDVFRDGDARHPALAACLGS